MKILLASIGLLQLCSVVNAGWKTDALNLHNKYRAAHGSPPLKLDNRLNAEAQRCADRHIPLNNGEEWVLDHTDTKDGENLAGAYGSKSEAVKDAIKKWYDEKKDYDYDLGESKNGEDVKHFTQIVWRDSQRLGIGIAYQGDKAFVCAQYSPSGNFPGLENFLDNVKAG